MPENYETIPMRERVAAVKEFRKEFGDDVPADKLESVGFVRQEGEDGLTAFLAVERLAQLVVLASQENEPQYETTLPETEFELSVPAKSKVLAKLNRRVLEGKMERLMYSFDPQNFSVAPNGEDWIETMIGEHHPFFDVLGGAHAILGPHSEHWPFLRYSQGLDIYALGSVCFGDAFEQVVGDYDEQREFFQLPAFLLEDEDPLPGEFLTIDESEALMTRLQTLRSIFSDEIELYRRYDRDLSDTYDTNTGASSLDGANDDTLRTGALIHLSALVGVLAGQGYPETASRLNGAQSFAEARQIIAEALQDNEVKRAHKQQEKEWQAKRKQATDPEEIKVLSVERARQKDALKASQRPLQGVDMYLNLPTAYSRYCLANIKELEEALLVKAEDGLVGLELDTKPNAEIDARAGEISGDCTAGGGLRFSEQSGLRNVKVSKQGKHIGNIYVLQTTEVGTDRKVWHFDAIQIPDRTLEWEQFPQILIDAFAALAEENDVQALTINSAQHHVSNYDYISKGFMRYFGTEGQWKQHDQMDLLPEAGSVCNDESRKIDVDTSRYREHAKNAMQIQAQQDRQIILWQSDK